MRLLLLLGVAGLVSCSGGGTKEPARPIPPTTPQPPAAEIKVELPAIPAKIDVTTSAPTDGNAPERSARRCSTCSGPRTSARWASSRKATDARVLPRVPARRAAHRQPRSRGRRADHRQRRHRAQPRRRGPRRLAEARQHAPARPTTRNGLNSPLHAPRHRAVRRRQAGARERAVARDRPPLPRGGLARSATSRQDQPTLSRSTRTTPDFSAEPAEVYVEAPAKLEFDKAQWVERLKRCSAKALKGAATRGTCGVVFQLNTSVLREQRGQRRSSSRGRTRSCRCRSASRPTTA